jgi:hypothetical protein
MTFSAAPATGIQFPYRREFSLVGHPHRRLISP